MNSVEGLLVCGGHKAKSRAVNDGIGLDLQNLFFKLYCISNISLKGYDLHPPRCCVRSQVFSGKSSGSGKKEFFRLVNVVIQAK